MNKRELGLSMTQTFKAFGGKLARSFRSHGVDLPMEQFIVLELLHRHENLILQEVSELLNKDKSGLLRTVDSLEKKKYIARVPNSSDRRKKNIVLTSKGLEVLNELMKLELETIFQALDGITDKDLEILSRCILRIQKNI